MQKVILTSELFEGAIELTYADVGVGEEFYGALQKVDLTNARLSDKQRQFLVAKIPDRLYKDFTERWGSSTLKITYVAEKVDFERDFWTPYGKKEHKPRAMKQWERLSEVNKQRVVASLPAYDRYLNRNPWRNKILAHNYIFNKLYETNWDEIFN